MCEINAAEPFLALGGGNEQAAQSGSQTRRGRVRAGAKIQGYGLWADKSACRCSIIVFIGENASRRFSDRYAVHDGDRDCCQSRDANRPTFR